VVENRNLKKARAELEAFVGIEKVFLSFDNRIVQKQTRADSIREENYLFPTIGEAKDFFDQELKKLLITAKYFINDLELKISNLKDLDLRIKIKGVAIDPEKEQTTWEEYRAHVQEIRLKNRGEIDSFAKKFLLSNNKKQTEILIESLDHMGLGTILKRDYKNCPQDLIAEYFPEQSQVDIAVTGYVYSA